jgi:4-carboxymuconolactone decarboxylase
MPNNLVRIIVAALVCAAASSSHSQAPMKTATMQGERFPTLSPDKMTPEQKKFAEAVLNGPRKALNGPFNGYMRSPELGTLIQEVGAYVRFKSTLAFGLRELAICQVARQWTSQYEWAAHSRQAVEGGIDPKTVQAIAEGKRPTGMKPDEQAIYEFTDDLIHRHEVTDAHYKAVADKFGEKGVMELIGAVGYFTVVAMVLNTDKYPSPEGAPKLPALK